MNTKEKIKFITGLDVRGVLLDKVLPHLELCTKELPHTSREKKRVAIHTRVCCVSANYIYTQELLKNKTRTALRDLLQAKIRGSIRSLGLFLIDQGKRVLEGKGV